MICECFVPEIKNTSLYILIRQKNPMKTDKKSIIGNSFDRIVIFSTDFNWKYSVC